MFSYQLFKFCFLMAGLRFFVDQDDESLRKWKEQLLAGVDLSDVGGMVVKDLSTDRFSFPFS